MQALLLAIGNDARQDDGLGWAFANTLEKHGQFPGEIAWRYQLQVEDADLIAGFNTVLFVDASKDTFENGFSFQPLQPALNFAFSTHALAPEAVLALAEQVCGKQPEAWLLAISGESWDLEFGLSPQAANNLSAALNFMEEAFRLMQLPPKLQQLP
jgi:hydrogenase maturation protease